MNATEQAILLDTEVRQWERRYNSQFSHLGSILLEFKVKELWRHVFRATEDMPRYFFHSFDDWLADAMPCSRSTGYSALLCASRLAGIPEAEREQIPPGNLRTLAEVNDPQLVESVQILDAAKSMKPKAFREKLAKEYPLQHLETQQPYRFSPTASQRERIDEAIALAIELDDAGDREQALERFAWDYWQENVHRRNHKPKAAAVSRVQ